MIVYAVILFVVAALCFAFGIAIRRGRVGLIHDYHRENIPQERLAEYGRAFSTGLFVLGAALLVSGILPLCGDDRRLMIASDVILFGGIAAAVVIFVFVQKKYNGGML